MDFHFVETFQVGHKEERSQTRLND